MMADRNGSNSLKPYRMGNPTRACYLREGETVLLRPGHTPESPWPAAGTLRVSVPVTIERVELVRVGRRRAYRLHGTTGRGTPVVSRDFYGMNVLHMPVPRAAR